MSMKWGWNAALIVEHPRLKARGKVTIFWWPALLQFNFLLIDINKISCLLGQNSKNNILERKKSSIFLFGEFQEQMTIELAGAKPQLISSKLCPKSIHPGLFDHPVDGTPTFHQPTFHHVTFHRYISPCYISNVTFHHKKLKSKKIPVK